MNAARVLALAVAVVWSTNAHAQGLRSLRASPVPVVATDVCGVTVPEPQRLPPAGSGPVVYLLAPCFPGHISANPPATYMTDIHLKASMPSQGMWVPYDDATEQVIFADFRRLWSNYALRDLAVEVADYQFANGVVGKIVTYHIAERR